MQIENICGKEMADSLFRSIELLDYKTEEISEKEFKSCECGEYAAKYLFIDELGNKLFECEHCLQEIIIESEDEEIKYEIIKL